MPTQRAYYGTEKWKITHIVVPLHSKVYLDAELAIKASNFIAKNKIGIESGSEREAGEGAARK